MSDPNMSKVDDSDDDIECEECKPDQPEPVGHSMLASEGCGDEYRVVANCMTKSKGLVSECIEVCPNDDIDASYMI